MSYTALYRKFRPDNFYDVKGQEHIVTTLKNQIKAERIGHAYLFTGTRGTGKTTIAKLFAKTVNCEHPVDGNPCNECRMCRGITAQTSMNVIEIDAASNNGVDNVREIVEEVRYSPTEGRYKVYIIDEVHMLSTGAFNALLKTIEEPPSYVIFILATTEVHKIPVTILSRCQRYDFKRITIDTITERLKELVQAESVDAEEKALRYVARVADGSMRDALSLLDQCISFYLGKTLTYDNVLEVLGAVDTQVFTRLLRLIQAQEVTGCIRLLDEIESVGRELGQFTIDFIWYLRNLLLLKTTDDISDMVIEISSENMALLQKEAAEVEEQTLMRYIRVFSELSNQIRYASRKRVLIEIALIKLCKPEMEQNLDSILDRIKRLEEKLENGVVVSSGVTSNTGEPQKAQEEKKPVVLQEALPEDIKDAANNWKSIIAQITKKSPALGSVLQSATLSIDGNGLLLVVTNPLDKDIIDRENHMTLIKDTIAQMIQKQVQLNTRYLDREKERLEEVPDLSKLVKMPIQYE
ncbi:DNA polymerase III subunit gamma/tau [Lachnospiraceae bacterium MD1]|uniref:DNA-directed DNA polymerase n=1 Tax=Variimorphobacter saccharofermentans TaxID=2755051 RepID=A0A839K403_9FIRM|nr:DNA polymerase III subunit gamma/tau [Variimorphobacter saccharofermentans]MBB2184633.1 DNA polymerase III subunit gamma/tau [Variimorphobacter saccharofermentans]